MVYHSGIEPQIRTASLRAFLAPPIDQSRQVLVCTDRTSMGLDTQYVEHVVLFDFARDPSEYIRRVGRTARGCEGTGIVSVLTVGELECCEVW